MPRIPFLDRLLSRRGGTRRFAAVAAPHGVQVVEYVRQRDGVVLKSGIRQSSPGTGVEALAGALAEGIEALGGRGGELALALSGFGTAHHILTLPPADAEILRPIVRRELLRYYPDLDDPVVDFVFGARAEGGAPGNREMIVGAVPRRAAVELSESLGERGIVLGHLTVLPQVLQSLYDTFEESTAAAVMVVVLESGILIGCFKGGALRLFIEPPRDVHGRPVRNAAAVVEQVERANLFLHQQFPNVRVQRVLLAAPAEEVDALRSALEERLDSEVVRLADVPPGPLSALGAALAAATEPSIQLLPAAVRPRTAAERTTRWVALAAGALVVVAGLWWAGAGIRVARAQAEEARATERAVAAMLPELNRTTAVLEARRAHEIRLAFLEETASTGTEVRRIMAAVAAETGSAIELSMAAIERSDEGWMLSLRGRSEATSSAAAVRAIDRLYRGIPDRLPVVETEFGELEGIAGGSGAPVAIGFDMSFIVLWQTDLAR